MLKIVVALIVAPAIELYVLVKLGKTYGALQTIAFVIAMGVLGARLAFSKGAGILSEVQRQIQQGKIPEDSVFDGIAVIICGLLFIAPGVVSDAAALAVLLFPPLRRMFARYLKKKMTAKFAVSGAGAGFNAAFGSGMGAGFGGFNDDGRKSGSDEVIDLGEGAFTVKKDETGKGGKDEAEPPKLGGTSK